MTTVKCGYIEIGGRHVHYRVCGHGPAIVMLHDSPRSSRLHLPTMAALADSFTVYAMDTPGYGNSAPLDLPELKVTDFAAALGEAIAALGLAGAPVYATHTSAKIALALAARDGNMPKLVLDGLSIPDTLSPESFISAYMRPFKIDDSGAYLASEWGRTRDMLRWFPWFAAKPDSRMMMEAPSAEWMADYVIDLFSAGPHYSDAYAAAMRWSPMADLLAVKIPTTVAARSDDVLYAFLDKVPVDANPMLSVKRLGTDREEWLNWLHGALDVSTVTTAEVKASPTSVGYLDIPHGQMHWQRLGHGAPLVALSSPTTLQALAWAEALAPTHAVLVPDLPGFGESAPLPEASADAIADTLAALITAQAGGRATVLGIGIAAPLAARLASRHPQAVAHLVIDGAPPLDPADAVSFGTGLCPQIDFDPISGSHLHRIWHLLRDSEVQWPWHDNSLDAARRLPPLFAGEGLHRALTGVLKQPRNWGQCAAAAMRAATAKDWAKVSVPTLVFSHADPAFSGSETIAGMISGARLISRPDQLIEAALLIPQGKE